MGIEGGAVSTVGNGKNAPAGKRPSPERNEHMEMIVRHQNFMLALRQLMGWPTFKPVNDAIAFTSGQTMSVPVGAELGRIAQVLNKDLVYSGWSNATAREPEGFAIAFRDLVTVDIIDRLVPFAADDRARLILVSTSTDEHFAIDARGSLIRVTGRPKDIRKGRALAMSRIKAVAATRRSDLLPDNQVVAPGAAVTRPQPLNETIVRFA